MNLKVENLRSYNGNKVPNQFYINDPKSNKIYFQSYDSLISEVDYNSHTVTLYEDFEYSQTTVKYRNIFFNKIGFNELDNTKDLRKAIKDGSVEKNGINFKIIVD